MAEIILEKTGMSTEESFHTIHNYIDTEEMILRKGAIAARKGEKSTDSCEYERWFNSGNRKRK